MFIPSEVPKTPPIPTEETDLVPGSDNCFGAEEIEFTTLPLMLMTCPDRNEESITGHPVLIEMVPEIHLSLYKIALNITRFPSFERESLKNNFNEKNPAPVVMEMREKHFKIKNGLTLIKITHFPLLEEERPKSKFSAENPAPIVLEAKERQIRVKRERLLYEIFGTDSEKEGENTNQAKAPLKKKARNRSPKSKKL